MFATKTDAGHTPKLEVVSASDLEPLAGATVWVRARGAQTHTWEGKTDAEGRYEIVPPDEATRWFNVVVPPLVT